MSTSYMPNGDVIKVAYDGQDGLGTTFYMIEKNGEHAGVIEVVHRVNGDKFTVARDNARSLHSRFPTAQAAIDFLTA